ncbi:MAG: hypothetical protein P0Y66_18330 [Candidatus Kaistia colombiensis]|nr:MAG: hypothetical protein P0Y66_18330 [Kaistia sp.]
MSIIHLRRSTSLLPISLAAGLLAVGVASASNSGARNDPLLLKQMEAQPPAAGTATQQSSASAWSESNGDHGMTVTTSRSGDSTSCMVVEWKRENGSIKKWQYRCDAATQP